MGLNRAKKKPRTRLEKRQQTYCPIHNLGLSREEAQFEIEKCHCLGQVRDGQQSTIICSRTRDFREEVYKNRKQIKNKKLEIKLSLTKRLTELATMRST